MPTDAYTLEEAVRDGYLAPPRAVSVPLKFVRQGIAYDELDDDARLQMEEVGWGDDDGDEPPDAISAADLNLWLFNEDTVDKAIEVLMTKGLRVSGGDRIGKSIVFARNQRHADLSPTGSTPTTPTSGARSPGSAPTRPSTATA